MNYTKKERDMYNRHREIVCERLGITKNQYNWFRRKGEALHKVYENNCNGVYNSEREYVLAEHDIQVDIVAKALELELTIYFQTDPRGASIYLDTQPILRNNYTRAHCIY